MLRLKVHYLNVITLINLTAIDVNATETSTKIKIIDRPECNIEMFIEQVN